MLFEGDADVNQVDEDGNTPMHLAVDNNHMDCVQLLLQLGASINIPNIRGSTPVRPIPPPSHVVPHPHPVCPPAPRPTSSPRHASLT